MLVWVKCNIVSFGGDFVYIMIGGESVGLMVVSVMMVLLLIWMLIVGVIGESGVMMGNIVFILC